jgi:Xaa-Pro aminopeptidase
MGSSVPARACDVVMLEPGLYVPNVGGLCIVSNYLVTDRGYEQLSHHTIVLK